jgi:hypothetical protein
MHLLGVKRVSLSPLLVGWWCGAGPAGAHRLPRGSRCMVSSRDCSRARLAPSESSPARRVRIQLPPSAQTQIPW